MSPPLGHSARTFNPAQSTQHSTKPASFLKQRVEPLKLPLNPAYLWVRAERTKLKFIYFKLQAVCTLLVRMSHTFTTTILCFQRQKLSPCKMQRSRKRTVRGKFKTSLKVAICMGGHFLSRWFHWRGDPSLNEFSLPLSTQDNREVVRLELLGNIHTEEKLGWGFRSFTF